MNVIGQPLPDLWWMTIYGVLALVSTLWWFEDVVLEMWEKYTTEDDRIYARTKRRSRLLGIFSRGGRS